MRTGIQNRTEKLNRFCEGRKKLAVAALLGVPPQMMSYLLRFDLDALVAKIDALELDNHQRSEAA